MISVQMEFGLIAKDIPKDILVADPVSVPHHFEVDMHIDLLSGYIITLLSFFYSVQLFLSSL